VRARYPPKYALYRCAAEDVHASHSASGGRVHSPTTRSPSPENKNDIHNYVYGVRRGPRTTFVLYIIILYTNDTVYTLYNNAQHILSEPLLPRHTQNTP